MRRVDGGDISGMTAALEVSEYGMQEILVEKNPSVGGWDNQLYYRWHDHLGNGWSPYDANKIQPYGYDRCLKVITSIEIECDEPCS